MIESIPRIGEIFALSAALSWAFAVILFKKSGASLRPLALNLFKNLVAIVLLTPTVPLVGGELFPDLPATTWALLALSGFLGIAVADSLFFVTLDKLGAGLSAVVDTSYTPILLGLSFALLGERIDGLDYLGAAFIVAGLLIGGASRPPEDRTRRDIVIGTVFGVLAMLAMGVSIVIIKPLLDDLPLVWTTWCRLAAGTFGTAAMIALHPRRRALFASLRPSPGWAYAVPASLLGTYVAMMLWVGGMKYTLVSRAALLNQLSVIFVFVLATLILREPLTWRRVAAVASALVGAVMIVL